MTTLELKRFTIIATETRSSFWSIVFFECGVLCCLVSHCSQFPNAWKSFEKLWPGLPTGPTSGQDPIDVDGLVEGEGCVVQLEII